MKKYILLGLVAIILIFSGFLIFDRLISEDPMKSEKSEYESVTESLADQHDRPRESIVSLDYKNCSYIIDGKNLTLKDGYSEEIISDSNSKLITRYFGNEISGDFNNDGFSDASFLLTQDHGGSGTFYYTVVALGGEAGCVGTNAVLLGDRIAPQTTEFRNSEIIVNYADRRPGEPMTTAPSVGVSKYFKLVNNQLVDVR